MPAEPKWNSAPPTWRAWQMSLPYRGLPTKILRLMVCREGAALGQMGFLWSQPIPTFVDMQVLDINSWGRPLGSKLHPAQSESWWPLPQVHSWSVPPWKNPERERSKRAWQMSLQSFAFSSRTRQGRLALGLCLCRAGQLWEELLHFEARKLVTNHEGSWICCRRSQNLGQNPQSPWELCGNTQEAPMPPPTRWVSSPVINGRNSYKVGL